jgi:V8-like Glu-specific endopeptidase
MSASLTHDGFENVTSSHGMGGAPMEAGEIHGGEATSPSGTSAGTEAEADDHAPVSSTGATREAAVAQAEHTSFETGVEWSPADRLAGRESMGEAEPRVDAYFASAPAQPQQQEFFGAIAGALIPVAKAVLPTVVAPIAKQAGGALADQAKRLLSRNAGRLISRLPGLGRESVADEDMLTEAGLLQLEQALASLEVVIGPDDRVMVSQTNAQPWRRICHLSITAQNGATFLGTGFFIGPRTVATAGHCVYIRSHGGWASQIVVTPGRNAGQKPFPSVTATTFRSVRGWTESGKRECDYAAIILPRSFSNPALGAFGFGAWNDGQLTGARLNLAGYPGDKPPGTMWFHGRVATGVSPRVITYDIDTAGGQSGSPVWVQRGDSRVVVGIHTNGAAGGNSATRIVKPVFDNLLAWRKEGE